MLKWTNDKKLPKLSYFHAPRNAWHASVALGRENAPWFKNFTFDETTKTTKKGQKSKELNHVRTEHEQNDYKLQTLYRRDYGGKKTATNRSGDEKIMTKVQKRIPPQHMKAQLQYSQDASNTSNRLSNPPQTNTTASKLNVTNQRRFLKHNSGRCCTKAPLLYEHYPLRPALLYGSPSSFICDPLKRLKQMPYLSESPELKFISSALSICQDALVDPEHMSTKDNATFRNQTARNRDENLENIQKSKHLEHVKKLSEGATRLKSGREGEYRKTNANIAKSALQTRNAYAAKGESIEKVCPMCRRNAFSVARDLKYDTETRSAFEDVFKGLNNTMQSKNDYKDDLPANDSFVDHGETKCKQLAESEEIDCKLRLHQVLDADESKYPENREIKLPSPQLTGCGTSLASDYNTSVPIFEVLTNNDYKSYANQPSLKQKDSLILYKVLKRKRNNETCDAKISDCREGKPTGFVRFFDEVRLDCKPSDEHIIFGNARGLRGKSQSWKSSRIEWLAELERRQEVRRRRQKRSASQKCQQNASESYLEKKCSFMCQRIRQWLTKWTQ
ncbi:uncharacterized protein [Eurosta solidaginis]|uniref:uncharacterized protein n=1 Tax=Eurosta solidaginis TaxID=178769 RepID=UPI0035313AEE